MPQILDKKDDFPLFHLIPSLATVHPKEKKHYLANESANYRVE